MTTENNQPTTSIAFTRYLYEKNEVLHSLLFALLNHNREEALFWAYELYFSGFEMELVHWIRWIYATFYSQVDKWFSEVMEINLSRLHTLPHKEERDCIIGNVIANLAHRHYDIQSFVLKYMNLKFEYTVPEIHNHRIYIHFRSCDLDKYRTHPPVEPAYTYLPIVSKYPVRKPESIFLRQYVNTTSNRQKTQEDTRNPYLFNWLYYAGQSPIWKSRITEYGGMMDNMEQIVRFADDDQLEAFYAKYGYEPEEQSEEIHLIHGVDAHARGVFAEQCPHEFIMVFSNGKIEKYSSK